MKKISKKSIIKGLKYTLDLALIIQFIGTIVVIVSIIGLSLRSPSDIVGNKDSTTATLSSPANDVMISLSNPNLAGYMESISNKFFIFCNVCGLINVIALILATLQMRAIIISFNNGDYFNPLNSKRIRAIAMVIFIWIILDYSIRFTPGLFIPHYLVSSSIGINSFSHGIFFGLFGFNLKILIVSIIVYILSIVFNYGNNLKVESDLTI